MVTLIGAGPGDYELMTLKAVRKLEGADVVLHDRLIGDGIISLIPDEAEKINVGKNAGRHPMPQSEINALILSKAREGLNVVRLKGGDPFVFGRGGEELELLAENGIEFEVVPGISSAIAAGEYAGIPVTHRDFASSLHIITGHARGNGRLDIDYEALVRLNGTLVFMMSVSTMREICEGLTGAGMDRTTPAAVIENATVFSQRKFIGAVATLPELASENAVVSPAVVIVGKVCGLSDKLDWFSRKPLLGRTVMVTSPRAGGSGLSARLRELGCRVLETPCVRIVPFIKNNAALDKAVGNIAEYEWLVFTSGVGVDLFFEYLSDTGFDIRGLHHIKLAAIGTGTKNELQRHGVFADYVPEQYNSRALALGLTPHVHGGRVLLARAKAGSDEVPDILAENGIICESVPLYDTVPETGRSGNARELLLSRGVYCVTFTSSSAVEGFVKAFPGIGQGINGLCIGERTAETAGEYGIQTAVSEQATINSMIEKLKEMLMSNGY